MVEIIREAWPLLTGMLIALSGDRIAGVKRPAAALSAGFLCSVIAGEWGGTYVQGIVSASFDSLLVYAGLALGAFLLRSFRTA